MANFTIVCWNSQHLCNNSCQLQKELRSYEPHIIGICETKLVPKIHPTFPGYKYAAREDGTNRSGGLTFLLRENIHYSETKIATHPTLSTIKHIVITVTIHSKPCYIYMFYNHSKNTSEEEYSWYLSNIQMPAIVMGDFNAHHHMWDPTLTPMTLNSNGKHLHSAILQHPSLTLLNTPGIPTRIDPYGRTNTTIHLCFGSGILATDYT